MESKKLFWFLILVITAGVYAVVQVTGEHSHELADRQQYVIDVCDQVEPNYKAWDIDRLEATYGKACPGAVEEVPEPYPFSKCFKLASKRYDIEPSLLAAIASVESSFDPLAVSEANAIGLMQIKWPVTAQELGITNRDELFNPCLNVEVGAKYISKLRLRFGSKLIALAAYYQGPTKTKNESSIPKSSIRYIERVLREQQILNN